MNSRLHLQSRPSPTGAQTAQAVLANVAAILIAGLGKRRKRRRMSLANEFAVALAKMSLANEFAATLAKMSLANEFAATFAKSAFADWSPDRAGGLGKRSRDFNRPADIKM